MQFFTKIDTYVRIAGCPESGLAALDWRRANGFSERADDRIQVVIDGEITEQDARALIAAGWVSQQHTNGDLSVANNVRHQGEYLPREAQPTGGYGWRAAVSATPQMSPIDLLILAAQAAIAYDAPRREQLAEARAAREAEIAAARERLASLGDDEILEIRAQKRSSTDDDTYYLTTDVGIPEEAFDRDHLSRLKRLIRDRADAVKLERAQVAEQRNRELLVRTRAILHEHAPQLLPRFDAGVLPDAELSAVLRGILLAPFSSFADYRKITKTEVYEAENAEGIENDDSTVKFSVEDVEDGEYECTEEQWQTITHLRKLASENGCTATVRLHSGTTEAMRDYVRRLGVSVCCEYAPNKRVCRELSLD